MLVGNFEKNPKPTLLLPREGEEALGRRGIALPPNHFMEDVRPRACTEVTKYGDCFVG